MTSLKYDDCLCTIILGKEPKLITVTVPVTVPCSISSTELSHRLIKHHNIPISYHEELNLKLENSLRAINQKFYRDRDYRSIQDFKQSKIEKDAILSFWCSKFQQLESEAGKQENEAEMFASMYHSVVHSSAVNNLLMLENSYAKAISSLVSQKETALDDLSRRQSDEMSEAMNSIGSSMTDADISYLAAHHLENAELLEAQWDSTLSAVKENQKREFATFVFETYAGYELSTPVTPKDFLSGSTDTVVVETTEPALQESFTIHMGAQMKQMHNIRLLAADVLQLCKYLSHSPGHVPPQRIQTSMSLYSHNLNGLVLLVDDRVNTFTGMKREFARVVARSTELHFPELEDQLSLISDFIPEAVRWRNNHPPPQYELDKHNQISEGLKMGDFYITKHSNLPDVHVVYHLIVDDNILASDISSRHPVILGIRNILKEMTPSWCQKRAELVFKCVKGFMMEMNSWGGTDMKNMQFLVPLAISEDLFNSLAVMLPSVFRVSNPLVIKTS